MKQVKKRNGSIVDFEVEKITDALRKAFDSVNVAVEEETLLSVTNGVLEDLSMKFGEEQIPSVENVQDLVELALMEAGYLSVAKHYIVYRYEHTKIREEKKQEVLEKIEEEGLLITTASGKQERFNEVKLRQTLQHLADQEHVGSFDIEHILSQLKYELYEGMTTIEVGKALIMVVRSMIERDPAYSRLASRLLLNRLYAEVFGAEFDAKNPLDAHERVFVANMQRLVAEGNLDERMAEFDLKKLARAMKVENDTLFEYMGLEIMISRYCMEDPKARKTLETPQMLWMRIAMGLAIAEKPEAREAAALEFYEVLSNFLYTPGGRTLFQSGFKKAQMSNCFLNSVPDSLDGIFKSISDNAQYLKWSGGTGTDWTKVRATGSFIKGTGVGSQGIVPFLKVANDVNIAINRSGKRRGAGCVYLETWHLDIEDFLELRKNTGDERRRTHDINTANWIPDLFMKRVRDNGEWTLFSPSDVPDLHDLYGAAFEAAYIEYEAKVDRGEIELFKRIPAADLWKKMIGMLFETGHPWITWKDASNVRSPQDHAGVVHNSNLCCMTADQRVVTQEGLVTVGYLYKKAQVLGLVSADGTAPAMNGSVQTVFGRSGSVQAGPMLLPRPNAPIVTIITKQGYTHKVTPDHKVWVVNQGWTEAQELSHGDKIEIQQSEGLFGTTDAPHEAYVCGIVAGDGTFTNRESGSSTVMIDVWANEFGLIEEVEQMASACIAQNGDGIFRTSSVRQPRFVGTDYKKRLASAPLARVLEKRGFTSKTKLTVPEFVWTGTKETVASYLRGLYAADATVEVSGEVTTCALASVSKELLADVQILLANFGIRSSLTQMRKAGSAMMPDGKGSSKLFPQNELYRLMVTSIQGCKLLEEVTGLGALRGNEKYLENLKKQGYTQKMHATFDRLEVLPNEDAYCLQVMTDEHSWTVNGLITKNTEITLNTSDDETAVCTLGSLNFAKFVTADENGVMRFDHEMVARVTRTAVRMLDNVIDLNFYPTIDAQNGNTRHRPVGLGVRGYHDALYMLGIQFDSPEALNFADESMEVVAYYTILGSSELAKERGTYSSYKGSKWDRDLFPQDTLDLLAKERGEEIKVKRGGKLDWTPVREHVKAHGMRNSNTMAIAPTASTANLVGCIPCVEPIYKNIYVKSNKEGEFVVVNKYLVEDLKKAGLWSAGMLNRIKYADGSIQNIDEIPRVLKEKYKEVFEIDGKWLVEAAARRGKWIDQSQSLNIFYNGTSGKDLSDIYFMAWEMGLKTTYYLRTLGASQVEKATVSTSEYGSTHNRAAGGSVVATSVVIEEIIEQAPELAVPSGFSASEWQAKMARVAAGEEAGVCESCES